MDATNVLDQRIFNLVKDEARGRSSPRSRLQRRHHNTAFVQMNKQHNGTLLTAFL